MVKYKTEKVIEVGDWDDLVIETYGKPYNFQQQNGCQSRGTFYLTVSADEWVDQGKDTILEEINGDEMGVKFSAWLARDPKQPVGKETEQWKIDLFWERNFYPDIEIIANDLCKRGLIEAGDYIINIDW